LKTLFSAISSLRLIPIFGLAAAYFAVGKLSLLLAIPPGYASPVWPAAGISLYAVLRFGYRVWPGVVLGSFLLNIFPTSETIETLNLTLFILPAGIGLGASLQACLGAFLVRRYSCFPTPSDRIEDLFKTMILGGPLSCLVNATMGPILLLSFSMIEWKIVPESFWTWWIGDTLGVLVVITFFSSWGREMKETGLKKRFLVSLPIIILFLLVVTVFLNIRNSEWEQGRLDFEKRTLQLKAGLHSRIHSYIEDLYAIQALFDASKAVEPSEFHSFVQPFLNRHPGIQALEWIPRITHKEKAAFQKKAQQINYPFFHITEKTSAGSIIPAGPRSVYFPVYYVEPYKGNEKVLGFNLASNPERYETMQKAHENKKPTASPGISLVQDTEETVGILIFLPVFSHKVDSHDPQKEASLLGYTLGVFKIDNIVEEAFHNSDTSGIEYHIYDVTSPGNSQLLYTSGTGHTNDSLTQLQWHTTIEVGERLWALNFHATDEYLMSRQNWQAYTFLTCGLFFASLFGAYILMFTGRAEKIKQTVLEKTSELTSAKNILEEEIIQRKKIQGELLTIQDGLERIVGERTSELQKSESLFRGLIESAPDAILIVDKENKIRLANRQVEKVFGYRQDELIGQSHSLLLPKQLHDLHKEHQKKYFHEPSSRPMGKNLELYGKRKDGTEFPVEISLSPINAGRENQVLSIARDISARKETEISLRERFEELVTLYESSGAINTSLSLNHVSKAAIKAIVSSVSPDMVIFYIKNNDQLIMQGFYSENPRDNRTDDHKHQVGVCLCGQASETGKSVYSRDIYSDTRCTLTECKQAGYHSFAAVPLVFGENILGVLGLASLAERDFADQATFLETLANQIAIGVQNAIFHEELQHQAEELELRVAKRTKDLHIAMEKAMEADQLKSSFLATMSHELRTPLNSIIGFTGIILMGLTGDLNDEQKKQLEMVQNSARHLLNLINDVLDISKIEAGQLETSREPFSMPETIEKVIKTMTPMAKEKSLQLTYDISENVGSIISDNRRVEQILINLINNAVKFTPKGSIIIICDYH
jgi:PAS domain S-box-containing protein